MKQIWIFFVGDTPINHIIQPTDEQLKAIQHNLDILKETKCIASYRIDSWHPTSVEWVTDWSTPEGWSHYRSQQKRTSHSQ